MKDEKKVTRGSILRLQREELKQLTVATGVRTGQDAITFVHCCFLFSLPAAR